MALSLIIGQKAFAGNPELIEAEKLNRELSKWVILDARPLSEWQGGHIPGALSFSWENFTRTDEKGIPFRVLPQQEMAASLGDMGIGENSPVVIYGDAEKSMGGEGWACWVFMRLGHRGPVRILSGGIGFWKANKFPLTHDAKTTAGKVAYNYRYDPVFDIDTAGIEQRRSSISLVDTRSTLEWLTGKIPGAVHIPWTEFYAGGDHRPIGSEALKKLLKDNGVDTNKPVVYYCRGGIRSGYAWMVHQLSGVSSAMNYDGGMEAWQKLSRTK